MKIEAAVVRDKGGEFLIQEIEIEEPRPDEVLVKVSGVGICHTDLICRDQYYPVPLPCVFGHEGSGVVVRVGERVEKLAVGDHVVMSYNSCGTCPSCRKSMGSYCYNLYENNFLGSRVDGSSALSQNGASVQGHFFHQSSFATYAISNEKNTVKVTKAAPLELLGPLGCGIQTGAGAVINALHPSSGSSIAIFGAGSVGLSAVMGAVVTGCTTIVVVDKVESRLELARELGATHIINPSECNVVERITAISGAGVNFSLECTGIPGVTRQAVDCLALTGICGQIGVAPLGTEVTLDINNIMFGRTIRGIVEGDSIPDHFIPVLIDLHLQGKFPFDKLVKFYDFKDINQAVVDTESGKVIKPILRP